jgi:hypothetical protein
MSNSTSTRFWMLKAQGGGSPTAVHTNLETARQRAETLARQLQVPIYLLEAVEVVVPDLPPEAELPVRWGPVSPRGEVKP